MLPSRPILLVLVLCLPPLLAAPPPSPLPVKFFQNLAAGKTQTVVVYGTSLTATGEWTRALKKWLDEEYPGQVRFVNSGGSGMNSSWGLENIRTKVLDHHPDLVFIEFSYNDAHDKFKLGVPEAAANLDRMVRAIREHNPDAEIILQTMNAGWDAPNGNRSLSVRPQLQEFNDNYRRYANEHHLPLLDHYENWLELKTSDPARFQSSVPDGSHPTPEASLAVTWPTIKSLLEQAQQAATR